MKWTPLNLFSGQTETIERPAPKRKRQVRKKRKQVPAKERRQQILDVFTENPRISNMEAAKKIGTSDSTISKVLKDMVKAGTITVKGNPFSGTRVVTPNAKRVNAPARQTRKRRSTRRKRLPNGAAYERVYKYISTHEDEYITPYKLSRLAGVSVGSAYRAVEKLEADKKIVSSEPTEYGRKFWLYESAMGNGPQPKETSETERTDTSPPRSNNAVMKLLEELVMEYIQENRDTNVLEFLNWLERLEKLD